MKDPTILILTGQSGSGKDTIYGLLKKGNPNLPRFSFGDLLREEIYLAFDMGPVDNEREPLMGSDGSNLAESFKHLMVSYGRAKILTDPYHYVRQVESRIKKLSDDTGNGLVVVTDCRRPHELQEIRRHFRSYTFRIQYGGSREMPLDGILENDQYTIKVPEMTLEREVEWIIDFMIRHLPHGSQTHPLQ